MQIGDATSSKNVQNCDIWHNLMRCTTELDESRIDISNIGSIDRLLDSENKDSISRSHLAFRAHTYTDNSSIRLVVNEAFQVIVIIEKLPPMGKSFKNYLKHKRKEMTVEDLIVRLCTKEDNKAAERRSKETSVMSGENIVEDDHNNSKKWKKAGKESNQPKKKFKGKFFNCGKIDHKAKSLAQICRHCDSQAAIGRARSMMYNGKSCHIRRKHNTVRELLSNGIITVNYVKSNDNVLNPLIKGLSREGVGRISKKMGLRPKTSQHGGNSIGRLEIPRVRFKEIK
ncbi:putative glucan endo-1,3-beta-glucosidase A-like [Capsicum annuum]|nr:putative glucan endo-1,3-beta-glucosidase A-like [Capsicum annuum]